MIVLIIKKILNYKVACNSEFMLFLQINQFFYEVYKEH